MAEILHLPELENYIMSRPFLQYSGALWPFGSIEELPISYVAPSFPYSLMPLPFLSGQSVDKSITRWYVSEQERSFQTRIHFIFLQESEIRAAFLESIAESSHAQRSDLSWAVSGAGNLNDPNGLRCLHYIDKELPLSQNIHAFTIGILVLMDDLDQISIERTYCRNHGIEWNN
eukprot:807257-Heterocapsa_arctica.AAC.1